MTMLDPFTGPPEIEQTPAETIAYLELLQRMDARRGLPADPQLQEWLDEIRAGVLLDEIKASHHEAGWRARAREAGVAKPKTTAPKSKPTGPLTLPTKKWGAGWKELKTVATEGFSGTRPNVHTIMTPNGINSFGLRVTGTEAELMKIKDRVLELAKSNPMTQKQVAFSVVTPGVMHGAYSGSTPYGLAFSNGSILINDEIFTPGTMAHISNLGGMGRFTAAHADDPVGAIITHEYGHQLMNDKSSAAQASAINTFNRAMDAHASISQLMPSTYAGTNSHEMYADAFTEYHLRNDAKLATLSPVTKELAKSQGWS